MGEVLFGKYLVMKSLLFPADLGDFVQKDCLLWTIFFVILSPCGE